MPPTYTGTPISTFYRAYWTWWLVHYNAPQLRLFGGGAQGPTINRNWGGYPVGITGFHVGVGFSGNMGGGRRVIKVEVYTEDADSAVWRTFFGHVRAAAPAPVTSLWTGLTHHVHRHPMASKTEGTPGVYSIRSAQGVLGFAPTAVPLIGGGVPPGSQFGVQPTVAVPLAVSVERCGQAGRLCAFHEKVFDLTNQADVAQAGAWMHASLGVFQGVLDALFANAAPPQPAGT